MNKVVLIGRLTSQPVLKYTTSNIAVTSFNLAVDRNYGEEKKTDFIPIVIWRKQAENVCNYLDKGSLVALEGSIQMRKYEDTEGNKKVVFEVVAENVQFLGTKSKEDGQVDKKEETDPFSDFGKNMVIDDKDLPF